MKAAIAKSIGDLELLSPHISKDEIQMIIIVQIGDEQFAYSIEFVWLIVVLLMCLEGIVVVAEKEINYTEDWPNEDEIQFLIFINISHLEYAPFLFRLQLLWQNRSLWNKSTGSVRL